MGFDIATNRIYGILKTYIKENVTDASIENVFWITGHSRGAAIANILSARLVDDNEKVYAYTFASPNTTTASNADAIKYDCIFNIVNEDDFVPYLPMNEWDFRKYGQTATISIENNYSQEWSNLLQTTYNSNISQLKNTVAILSTIATDRNNCYEYREDSEGYAGFSKRVEITEYEKLVVVSEFQLGGLVYVETYCVYQQPMYLMQCLAKGMAGGTVDKLVNVAINPFAPYLMDAKNSIVSIRNYIEHPHYCESYIVLSKKLSGLEFK